MTRSPTSAPDTDGATGLPAAGFTIRAGVDASNFGKFTASNINQSLAILLDDQIQSLANIRSRIPGRGVITGGSDGFTQEELRRLIAVIRSGSLPVKPVLDSGHEVGPSLGEAAIDRGLRAGILSLALVLVFLTFYYRKAGMVACMALVVNMVLLLGVLAFLEATLTLPGIAGLILTIGMAVDANILIFERIREEHEKGKTMAQSVKSGFEKAFFTIVDANVTTFLTAFFLFRFGTGPIRGFAVILMIGLATSMFSALYFSKTVFAYMVDRKLTNLPMMRLLAETKIGFLQYRRATFIGSVIAIATGLVLFFAQGTEKYGMDFVGGNEVQLQFQSPITQAEVRDRVQSEFEGAEVVSVGDSVDGKSTRFQVKMKGSTSNEGVAKALGDEASAEEGVVTAEVDENSGSELFARRLVTIFENELVEKPILGMKLEATDENGRRPFSCELRYAENVSREAIVNALKEDVGNLELTGDDEGHAFTLQGRFNRAPSSNDEAEARIFTLAGALSSADGSRTIRMSNPTPSKSFVGPRVGVELRDAAIRAMFFSLLGIIIYIRIRFRQYRYGFAACLALIHDVLFTLGAIALIRLTGIVDIEIDLAIIAAFLTIIGYSLNDTIVIFDRVRENLPRTDRPISETLDRSINQTLSRTVLTSLTTLISVAILFAFNLGQRNVLEGFAASLIVGVVVGTYSTIFVASPAVMRIAEWIETKKKAAA